MKLVQEDLWSKPAIYVVTTNGTLRNNGSLVMGRGAALQATQRYPGIDIELGENIMAFGERNGQYWKYGYTQVYSDDMAQLGAFQVKWFWGEDAALYLIQFSTDIFKHIALTTDEQFRMNFPGIGNGRLGRYRNEILEILRVLPDNVTVCYK